MAMKRDQGTFTQFLSKPYTLRVRWFYEKRTFFAAVPPPLNRTESPCRGRSEPATHPISVMSLTNKAMRSGIASITICSWTA